MTVLSWCVTGHGAVHGVPEELVVCKDCKWVAIQEIMKNGTQRHKERVTHDQTCCSVSAQVSALWRRK